MKKQICMMMAAMMAAAALTGCSGGAKETTAAPTAAKTAAETTQAPAAGEETEAESSAGETMAAQAGESAEILVAAAASLKNAYEDELIPMFQEQYPGVIVKGTYDSSGKLQTQIEEGLEADVFMSAATKQMTALDPTPSPTCWRIRLCSSFPQAAARVLRSLRTLRRQRALLSETQPACLPDSTRRKLLPA